MDNLSPITIARFWSKVDVMFSEQECWEWRGSQKHNGYGTFRLPGPTRQCVPAHRVAYSLVNGKIPTGLIVRHTCDNPSCVNPNHLLTGTHQDNADDKVARGRSRLNKPPQSGVLNFASKLTADQVSEIRKRIARGERNTVIARDYPVGHATISKIRTGNAWAD